MQHQATLADDGVYTRQQPSARYLQLVELYQQMHLRGNGDTRPADMFPGISLAPQAERIAQLIKRTQAKSLLDYGCGKGLLYRGGSFRPDDPGGPDIKTFWGIQDITLYDPAYPLYMKRPQGTFDGVICTDVLEHCPQEDLPWILAELFSYASHFVFANIACYPARKTMPNGENAHCTVQPAAWWQALIERTAGFFPQVQYQFIVAEIVPASDGSRQMIEGSLERIFRR